MNTTPSKPQATNRRRFVREPLNLLVQCRFDSVGDFLSDHTLNLSEGGMFLKARHTRPVGAQIYFQIMLREGTPLVEGLGRVVRVVEPGTGEEPGMAVEFINLDETSQEVIREVIARKGLPPTEGNAPH